MPTVSCNALNFCNGLFASSNAKQQAKQEAKQQAKHHLNRKKAKIQAFFTTFIKRCSNCCHICCTPQLASQKFEQPPQCTWLSFQWYRLVACIVSNYIWCGFLYAMYTSCVTHQSWIVVVCGCLLLRRCHFCLNMTIFCRLAFCVVYWAHLGIIEY